MKFKNLRLITQKQQHKIDLEKLKNLENNLPLKKIRNFTTIIKTN